MITFSVHGTPKPQGSKKAFIAAGRAVMKEAAGNEHAAWRNAIAQAAMDQASLTGQLNEPLEAHITFRFPMPKSRTKLDRETGWRWRSENPDVDKLARTVFDGLVAGGLIRDDNLIVIANLAKMEVTDWTGVYIVLEPVNRFGAAA